MSVYRVGLLIGYAVFAIIMAGAIAAHFVTQSTFGVMALSDEMLIAALFVDAIGLHVLRIVFNASLKRQIELGEQPDVKTMTLARVVYLTWGLMVVVALVAVVQPRSSDNISEFFDLLAVMVMFFIGFTVGLPMILLERRRRARPVNDQPVAVGIIEPQVSTASASQPVPKSAVRIAMGIVLILVGSVAFVALPALMTGGDSGDAGLIYFVLGLPVGLIVGAIFITSGIVVLVTGGRSSSHR